MACRLFLMAVLLLAFADQALANWWIVRDASDEKCLVVDLEPTGNDKTVTKVGEVYQTPHRPKPTSNGSAKNQRPKIGRRATQEMLSEIV
jgi:hypothetical protein